INSEPASRLISALVSGCLNLHLARVLRHRTGVPPERFRQPTNPLLHITQTINRAPSCLRDPVQRIRLIAYSALIPKNLVSRPLREHPERTDILASTIKTKRLGTRRRRPNRIMHLAETIGRV